jgi:hypothetical protein
MQWNYKREILRDAPIFAQQKCETLYFTEPYPKLEKNISNLLFDLGVITA